MVSTSASASAGRARRRGVFLKYLHHRRRTSGPFLEREGPHRLPGGDVLSRGRGAHQIPPAGGERRIMKSLVTSFSGLFGRNTPDAPVIGLIEIPICKRDLCACRGRRHGHAHPRRVPGRAAPRSRPWRTGRARLRLWRREPRHAGSARRTATLDHLVLASLVPRSQGEPPRRATPWMEATLLRDLRERAPVLRTARDAVPSLPGAEPLRLGSRSGVVFVHLAT